MGDAETRAYAATKRFGSATRERWLRCVPADQAEVLNLATRLRLGENHVRDLLDALEAIAQRRSCTFADILAVDAVRDVLTAERGRNETLHALKQVLRRLRYPQLAATELRLRALTKELGLPTGVSITLPENLEGEEIVVSVRAASASELRRRMAGTVDALGGSGLDEMYRVLGGEW